MGPGVAGLGVAGLGWAGLGPEGARRGGWPSGSLAAIRLPTVPFDPTTLSWLVIVALVLSAVAAGVAWAAVSRQQRRPSGPARPASRPKLLGRTKADPLTAEQATREIEALQLDVATSLRHLAVVRYDAFGDMGGHLSWSMALLDDRGDGVVLTSIHGRSDSRTYAKNVSGWSATQQLSPEEEEAIGFARRAS